MTHQAPLITSFSLADEGATTRFGQRLAGLVGAGDAILLEGPIGAGKSHIARALIQTKLAAEGLYEDVPSPTYTLVQTYMAGELEIWHTDLYRLSDTSEVQELGLEDVFDTALCLIEWPDRLGAAAPPDPLKISIEVTDPGRRLSLEAAGSAWADRLARLSEG
ncbi:MAG: tRNA (adenosine(37)-N6)-threonylcarbamoyltransferase complex ATPase subunit type 1 TsaE, partial [Pseudomonadota bacterium]